MSQGRRWTAEAIIEALREVVAERGADLALAEFCRWSGVPDGAVRRLFGSWTGLRREVGLPEPRRDVPPIAPEEVIARLREIEGRRGGPVSQAEFCAESGISELVVHRRLGGWLKLRGAAGLKPERRRPGSKFSREGLRDALVDLTAQRGPRVTLAEFVRAAGASEKAIQCHWGSWTALQRATGLKPNRRRSQWSDEDLLREYQRVVRLLDKIPTAGEFHEYGRCSMQTLCRRFGDQRELKRRFARYLMAQKQGTLGRTLTTDEMRRLMGGG